MVVVRGFAESLEAESTGDDALPILDAAVFALEAAETGLTTGAGATGGADVEGALMTGGGAGGGAAGGAAGGGAGGGAGGETGGGTAGAVAGGGAAAAMMLAGGAAGTGMGPYWAFRLASYRLA